MDEEHLRKAHVIAKIDKGIPLTREEIRIAEEELGLNIVVTNE